MKIRSRNLYAYLLDSGVLHGSKEDIVSAKQEYRRKYKQQWKQQKRPRKEIRIEVTLKQYEAIKTKAMELELPPTTYCRSAILAAIPIRHDIPYKDKLLKILQFVSRIAIATNNHSLPLWQVCELANQAETILLNYLKSNE